MDSDKLASMYAEIVRGVSKNKSIFCKGAEASKLWDKISGEVATIRKQNPKAQFSIPNEIP